MESIEGQTHKTPLCGPLQRHTKSAFKISVFNSFNHEEFLSSNLSLINSNWLISDVFAMFLTNLLQHLEKYSNRYSENKTFFKNKAIINSN